MIELHDTNYKEILNNHFNDNRTYLKTKEGNI